MEYILFWWEWPSKWSDKTTAKKLKVSPELQYWYLDRLSLAWCTTQWSTSIPVTLHFISKLLVWVCRVGSFYPTELYICWHLVTKLNWLRYRYSCIHLRNIHLCRYICRIPFCFYMLRFCDTRESFPCIHRYLQWRCKTTKKMYEFISSMIKNVKIISC